MSETERGGTWFERQWWSEPWPSSAKDAVELQKKLRDSFVECPLTKEPTWVAGVDISNERFGHVLHAAAVLARFDAVGCSYEVEAVGRCSRECTFPYVPGLLSFREGPAALQALAQLPRRPDLIIFDGHGRAHPRRFGIACHLGLLTGVASLGCGKTPFVGEYAEPSSERGSYERLHDADEELGMVLRTRERARPVFLSCGYGLMRAQLVALMMKLTDGRHRLCFVQRKAHEEANAIRRAYGAARGV